jgi:hypothetical protein
MAFKTPTDILEETTTTGVQIFIPKMKTLKEKKLQICNLPGHNVKTNYI